MSSPHQQVNLLSKGILDASITRESFAKNVLFHNGNLEVRQGFGQLAEYDIGLGQNFEDPTQINQQGFKWGYRKHLGSKVIYTDFGHVQIVTVMAARVNTGNELNYGMSANLCVVSIYDVTTGDRWEEPLHRHTGDNNRDQIPMSKWVPQYNTCVDRDYQDWIQIEGDDEFYFAEFRDILFFGSRETGMLAYFPAVFRGNRNKQVDKVSERDHRPPYGESSLIVRAVPSQGVFVEGISYLTRSEFPNPTTVVALGNRLVYAVDRTLYFSEVGQPTNIRADNYVQLTDVDDEITALSSQLGNLNVYTDSEFWVYHPSEGSDTVALGRLIPVDRTVGCCGKNAITYRQNKVVWVDSNGVYATSGNYVVERLSQNIDNFFKEKGLADPTSHYSSRDGHTYYDADQPTSFYYFDPDRVHLSYWHHKELLLIDVPGQKCTLVLCDNNEWCFWNYETRVKVAQDGSPVVEASNNIQEQWLLPYKRSLYCVGGDFSTGHLITDNTTRPGGAYADSSVTAYSYYILEYARGGALDRSTLLEDYREITGKYDRVSPEDLFGVIFLDKWIPIRPLDVLPNGSIFTTSLGGQAWLLPISIVPREGYGASGVTTSLQIHIRFDNAIWRPWLTNFTEINYILPHERLLSVGGYSPNACVAGTSEVRIYNSSTGLLDADGDEIRIWWDQASAGVNMNLIESQRNRIMYIPMLPVASAQVADDVGGTGAYVTVAQIDGSINLKPCVWTQFELSLASKHWVNQHTVQAVDWAYKSPNLESDGAENLTALGLIIRAESHGDGDPTTHLEVGWEEGMLNVLADVNGKLTQAQRVDYWTDNVAGVNPAVAIEHTNLETIKEDVKIAQDGTTLYQPVFETSQLTWADKDDPDTDVYLIADDKVQDLATDGSKRGRRVSYMLFGSMRDRVHRLIFSKIQAKIMTRPAGVAVRHSGDGGGAI